MMKKILLFILSITLLVISLLIMPEVEAITITSAPYNTYTVGPNGDLVLTQTAYEPSGVLTLSEQLLHPSDFYIKDDDLYVADTGNKRIVKVGLNGTVEVLVTGLNEPTGVHVDENNQLYVADKGSREVYIYDTSFNLIKTISKPYEQPIFGSKRPFIPLKISTGPRGIIYVTGEGATSGVMQFNYLGEFLGYLATNPTNVTFYRKVLEFFNQNLAPVTPLSPENLAVDSKGSIYTTSHTDSMQLKKFNIASKIVLSPAQLAKNAPVAVYVNDFGNIYSINDQGIIQEYDAYGNLLFMFGEYSPNTEVLGLFNNSQDIVVDSKYNIYVLDQGRSQIQVLARSEFTKLVHDGLRSLNDGLYDVTQWEDVLRMNSVFALANSVIARTYYRTGDYETALDYYLIAQDRDGYSDAYWQVRNNFLQQYLGIFLSLIIVFIALRYVLRLVDHKYEIYNPVRKIGKELNDVKILRELKLGMSVFRHPINTFHEIKHEGKASVLSASILYLLFVLLNVIAVYTVGFIFNTNNLESYNVLTSFLGTFGFLMLFVFSNYLISTLSNGEGWFKDIYIATAYALMPYILMTVPIILLSHAFTMNEMFIFQSLLFFRDAWMIILVVIMVMEVHSYSFRELAKNLLLTIFTMAVIVAILLLLFLLTSQMYDYLGSIFKEVINRVFD